MAQYMWHQPPAPAGSSFLSSAYQPNNRSFVAGHDVSGSMRQKPSRVMKPTSAGNSPRRMGRRTMISQNQMPSQAPTRNGRPEDSLYPALLAAASAQRARPISWHPTSAQHSGMVSQVPTNTSWQVPSFQNLPTRPYNGTSSTNVNGLVTPLSYPNSQESPSEDMFPLMDGYQTYSISHSPSQRQHMIDSNQSPTLWPMNSIDPSYYPFELQQHHHDPSLYPQQQQTAYAMPERGDAAYYSSRSSEASLTPDILPIQRFDDEPPTPPSLPQKPDPLGDELVGMGLYDEPESPSPYDPEHDFMMRADGTVVPVPRPTGKGLKLEETFVPSTNDGSNSDESAEGEKDNSNLKGHDDQNHHHDRKRENVEAVPNDNNGRWYGNNDDHLTTSESYPSISMPATTGSFYFDDENSMEPDYLKPVMFPGGMYANNSSTPGYGWI